MLAFILCREDPHLVQKVKLYLFRLYFVVFFIYWRWKLKKEKEQKDKGSLWNKQNKVMQRNAPQKNHLLAPKASS